MSPLAVIWFATKLPLALIFNAFIIELPSKSKSCVAVWLPKLSAPLPAAAAKEADMLVNPWIDKSPLALILPSTWSFSVGAVVPIPILPFGIIVNLESLKSALVLPEATFNICTLPLASLAP